MTGFTITLIIRLLGGEAFLGWKAAVAFPWYDPVTNTQYFPFKTMAMLVGLGTMLGVSYLTDWAMTNRRLDMKWLRYVNNRVGALVPTEEPEEKTSKDDELSLQLMSNDEIVNTHQDDGKFS